jgi:hypothetical protein
MKPELGKYYKTRGGHKARVICADRKGGPSPIIVLVLKELKLEFLVQLSADGSYLGSGQPHSDDLISEWIDKPEWDWSKAADWHVAIAMDEDKRWFPFREVPSKVEISWCGSHDRSIPPEHAPKWTGDWRESLIVRPGFEKGEDK